MKALIVVDMQNDFMPGGPLGVPGADAIVPLINRLMEKFPLVIATQDWHPEEHISFAKNHPGKKVGDIVMVQNMAQILWPVHCVQQSRGAEFVKGLKKERFTSIFYKGTDPLIDSYSAFYDNAHLKSTGLLDDLKARKVDEIYLVGVATDYCVLYSALDALKAGLKVHVILDACRGIDLKAQDIDKAIAEIERRGGHVMRAKEVLKDG